MPPSFASSSLIGSWLHSHEEDTRTEVVYRREEFDFPPARGRAGFQLEPDGTLAEIRIGPSDRPLRTSGTWRLIGDDCLEFFTSGIDHASTVLKIKTVNDDKLVVGKEPPSCGASGNRPSI